MAFKFADYSHYLFVFAHPDDEIYTCAYIQKLTQDGKEVDVLYVTSGDYQGPELGPVRETEVLGSMQMLGVSPENIHFSRIPERQLMQRVGEVRKKILRLAEILKPDCVVGHDYEGGHNGHDAVSFCTSRAAKELQIPLFVFPAYHGWPENRAWNRFASERKATETLELATDQKELQDRVMAIHSSQEMFFTTIKRSDDYMLFSAREVLRLVPTPPDYTKPPTTPIGYEYPGSKIRFDDFKKALLT